MVPPPTWNETSTLPARAAITAISSLSNINSAFLTSSPSHTTISDSECYDIRTCRTLVAIVQSCLVTILACVWFAVHRNIPEPKEGCELKGNFAVKAGQWFWYKILNQRQAAIVFIVALLVPEWILAWALRQFFGARSLRKRLEGVAKQARKSAELKSSESSEEVPHNTPQAEITAESRSANKDNERDIRSSNLSVHSDKDRLIELSTQSQDIALSIRSRQRGERDALTFESVHLAMARSVGKDTQSKSKDWSVSHLELSFDIAWTTAHALFVIMGGYHFFSGAKAEHPLSPKDVTGLVKRGEIVPPTDAELANQSKGDAFSKGVAIFQTLWFVMQCIARRIEHLPLTSLEVMTLAYTVITVAMYAVWWDKPLNVSCAVRVPYEQVEKETVLEYKSVWDRVMVYVMGGQDMHVDLSASTRVPTFWAGDVGGKETFPAVVIALLVAMVFGAVHCIAWHDTFPSPLEQQLWRASAIVIITMPAALVVCFGVGDLFYEALNLNPEITIGVLYVPIALIYIAARLALIIISINSLKVLPIAAYRTVQWTTFIPHV